MALDKLQKIVSVKSRSGKYSIYPMTFNNEQHFDNWFKKVHSNGSKVIGIFDPE